MLQVHASWTYNLIVAELFCSEVSTMVHVMAHLFFSQAANEPAYLTVGTEVSAKYRGAFCEAKIKTVKRMVKVKVRAPHN